MKKSLIALAVLAAAGSASAQSSVTLFGIVDATLAWGRGGGTSAAGVGGGDRFRTTNSGYNSSRLGFRGREDLGGGMFATFWLEAGVDNDDGTGAATNVNNTAAGGAAPGMNGSQGLTFSRRSYVSLGGTWGELLIGREYTPQFWNLTVFDPFGTNGVGTTQTLNSIITGVTAVRASNMIQYSLPRSFGGFYGQLAAYFGEQLSNAGATSDDGDGIGLRVGFASGPFNVALALSRTEYAAGDVRQNNLGGQWDFGVARLMGHISRDENGTTEGRGWLIGASVLVGPGEIRAAYSTYRTDFPVAADLRTRKLALGYVHNLSKRTALYGTYARVRNSGYAAGVASPTLNAATGFGGASSSGVDLGIRHSF